MPTTATTDLLTRRAPIAANSVDLEARTASVVFSTGAPVQRRDIEGPFLEVLSMAPEAIDLSGLKGAPVLNAHRQFDVANVLGVVTAARSDGRQATAEIKLSARAADILRDMADDIVRNVSVGYSVEEWQDGKDAKGVRTRTATRWTPREISLVAVGADPGATVRGKDMDKQTDTAAAPANPAPPEDKTTRAAVETEIRSIARIAGLGEDFAAGLIERKADAAEARRAAFEELAKRDGGPIRTAAVPAQVGGADWSDISTRAAHIGEALYTRVDPKHEPSAAAREFMGLTIPEIARTILRARGIATTGLSPDGVITRALHSTSDFPLILADTVNRTLRAAYQAAPAGVRRLGRQTTARDFRLKHRLQLGEASTLTKVNEHGEFTRGTMAEGEETYKIDTYGRIFGITRQALVNDDVGAFADLSARLGQAAAEFEAQFLIDLLTANSGAGPTLKDGNPLFHSSHGNLAGSGAAPSETTLSDARLAMRKQTGLSGKPINVTPAYLLVPAALETTAEKLIATIQAETTANVNVFAGRLQVAIDARLDAVSATRWYVVADPMAFDGLEYAYLEGAEGPQIESRTGFDVDGVEIKVREDFGAGWVDHRGWYANDGA